MSLTPPSMPVASASTSALETNGRPFQYEDFKSRSLDSLVPSDDDMPPAYPGPPTRPHRAPSNASLQRRSRRDEPPPYFARAPDVHMRYGAFATTAHVGASADLRDGFPVVPPPNSPFTEHDVTRSDWSRFLDDLKKAARTAGMTARVNLRQGSVGELLDSWNHHFFHPRHMHLVLALGSTAYTGRALLPPDVAHPSPQSSPSGSPRVPSAQPKGFLDAWEDRRSEFDYKRLSGRPRRRSRRGLIGTVVVLGATAVMAAVDQYQDKKTVTAAGTAEGVVVQAPAAREMAGPSSASMGVPTGPPPPENKWRIVIAYRP